MMKIKKNLWLLGGFSLLLLLVLVFGLTGAARAAEFREGDTVIIPANERIADDLFVGGNRVEVNGTIEGDLFAVGTEVVVNGTVEGSLFIAGQTLTANGPVGGSLYSGGYALTIGPAAVIERNVYFGGFSLDTAVGSTVGRSLYAGNYQTILDGEIANDVNMSGAALEVNGIVGGDVTGELSVATDEQTPIFIPNFPGSVPIKSPGLSISDDADIGGDLDIREVDTFQTDGPQVLEPPSLIVRLGRQIGERAGEFIALLIVGGVLLQIWPASMQRTSAQAQANPVPSAGWGCLGLVVFVVGIPIAVGLVIVLAVIGGLVTFGQLFNDILSLGGASLGLIVAAFSFVVSLVTKAIVSYLSGHLILERVSPQIESARLLDFASLALGALIFEILRAIPFFGWLIGWIVTLVGLGAIIYTLRGALTGPSAIVEAA
jgi:hypothetical protein